MSPYILTVNILFFIVDTLRVQKNSFLGMWGGAWWTPLAHGLRFHTWQTWGGQPQLCYLFGYRSLVTPQWHFEKGNLVKIRCRVSLTYVVCMDYVETWGKRPLLACNKSAGGWYESITNHAENLSSHTNLFIVPLSGASVFAVLWWFSSHALRTVTSTVNRRHLTSGQQCPREYSSAQWFRIRSGMIS